MKVIAALLLVCAACGGDDIELYPVNPGGGGPTSGTARADASEGDGDSGVEIDGKVCLINDARSPTTCAATGAGGLTVALGMRTATTMDDGTFSVRVISGVDNVWHVTGSNIVSSAMTFGAATVIPALSSQVYTDMLSVNNATFAGTGAIIAKLTSNNAPLVGATVSAAPAAARSPLYDSVDATTWDQTATGALGVAWVPGITPTTTESLTVTTAADVSTTIMNIPVFADTITYVFPNI